VNQLSCAPELSTSTKDAFTSCRRTRRHFSEEVTLILVSFPGKESFTTDPESTEFDTRYHGNSSKGKDCRLLDGQIRCGHIVGEFERDAWSTPRRRSGWIARSGSFRSRSRSAKSERDVTVASASRSSRGRTSRLSCHCMPLFVSSSKRRVHSSLTASLCCLKFEPRNVLRRGWTTPRKSRISRIVASYDVTNDS
jgi:hypothetical protein